MKFPRALYIGIALTMFGAMVLPEAAVADDVVFNLAPPRPRVEEVPPPRAGFVWSPGYWDVRNNRHSWQQGHFERVRKGQRYEAPAWRKRDDRWTLDYGRWNKNAAPTATASVAAAKPTLSAKPVLAASAR